MFGLQAAAFRASVERLHDQLGLIRKHYLFNVQEGAAARVYLWESRATAEALYTPARREIITARYDSEPIVTWFDTPLLLNNRMGEVVSEAAT